MMWQLALPIVLAVMTWDCQQAFARTARAFQSGNALYDWCTASTAGSTGLCTGYVAGVADSMSDGQLFGFRACIPNEVTGKQATDTVILWLAENPNKRHLGAAGLVAEALASSFPCH